MMKLTSALLGIVFVLPSLSLAYELNGKVIGVTDGDTIKLLTADKQQHKIRLYGIDAPERKQPFGQKSRQMLADFVFQKTVTTHCTTKDRYKRDVCIIYLGEADINAKLVMNGGAWVYRQYYKLTDTKGIDYYNLEQQAKHNKLGLWKTSEYQAMPPWEWRKIKK